MILLSGCAAEPMPSYSQVREETLDVLRQVAAFIPEPKQISETPEFVPYPCDEELAFGTRPGAFFTGQCAISVSDDFDVRAFVGRVPELLGDGWEEDPLGIPVSFAQVHMVRKSPRMTITVEESVSPGTKAVELLAISRCGAEEPETDEPARQ